MKKIEGNIVDAFNKRIYSGKILIEKNRIVSIEEDGLKREKFILPGFIDSHIHIESTMLSPSNFSRLVVPRGTIAVVCDPHEIANVLGEEGINYMIEDSKNTPLKCFFGVSSCVPASSFDSSGYILDSKKIELLIKKDEFYFLAEMMNYPGVINKDPEVIKKIEVAKKYKKPIDGHAPGLKGKDLEKYISAGIYTDHECSTIEEAIEKISLGVNILIREGSAAKNFNSLYSLISTHPSNVMLCTDDSHPDDLIKNGHIDALVRKGLTLKLNIFDLIRAASINPVVFYKLPVGLLRVGDKADFIIVDDLKRLNILSTYIDGQCAYSDDQLFFPSFNSKKINNFELEKVNIDDLKVPNQSGFLKVIRAFDGNLITDSFLFKINSVEKYLETNVENDILKIVAINRYEKNSKPFVAFINGFGIHSGAFGSSIAHDSHNLIVVGTDDESIYKVLQKLIENKGGLVVCCDHSVLDLKLNIAGLMSSEEGSIVSDRYALLTKKVHDMGSKLNSPFMTLSFMSLLVIPHLKIEAKGLFDVDKFQFTHLFESSDS